MDAPAHLSDDERTWKDELAKLVAARELSPVELMEHTLARAETLNPRYNAICTWTAEAAMERARTAEAAVMRGDDLGALHGVPTPLNRAVQQLASRAAREGVQPGSMRVAEIYAAAEAQHELARREGFAACLEGALCYAALKRDVTAGRVRPSDRVVIFNTATSLKGA